jgi:hypothetical protein
MYDRPTRALWRRNRDFRPPRSRGRTAMLVSAGEGTDAQRRSSSQMPRWRAWPRGHLGTCEILQGAKGASCGKLSRNVASPVHLADERLPAHCWRHSPGYRVPCMGTRGTGDVACSGGVHPCRHRRRRCRDACVVDPRMVASLIPWAPLTHRSVGPTRPSSQGRVNHDDYRAEALTVETINAADFVL